MLRATKLFIQMQITRDDWTPLFDDLKKKVSSDARRELLFKTINELRLITQQNFGREGVDRPKPWQMLKKAYADKWKYGDQTPTLIMSDEKHNLRNPNVPHLIQMFRVNFNDKSATLTNDSPYADTHQLGYGVAERPYYPVAGDSLTPFAESKIEHIVAEHFRGQK